MLSVADHAAEYQYPVEVDPEVIGKDYSWSNRTANARTGKLATGKTNPVRTCLLRSRGSNYWKTHGRQ